MDVFMLYASVQASDLKANCCYLNESPPFPPPPSSEMIRNPKLEAWLSSG